MVLGIPELIDEEFMDEMVRRCWIINPKQSLPEIHSEIEKLRSVREFGYDY
jgi:hypothetical protein